MDLDDSFTENLLEKMKVRQARINEKKREMLPVGKKRSAIDENQLNPENPSRKESPKKQCTEMLNTAYLSRNKENFDRVDDSMDSAFIPIHTASKVRGLAALKKNSSSEDLEVPKVPVKEQETPTAVKSPVKPVSEYLGRGTSQNSNVNGSSDEESSVGDEGINENDFAENYDNCTSDNESKMDIGSPVKQIKIEKPRNGLLKSELAECPKSSVLPESSKSNVDPAELPLVARKALFEKALLGDVPKLNETAVDNKLSVAQRAAMFENASKSNASAKSSNFKGPSRIAVSKFSRFEENYAKVPTKSPEKIQVKPVAEVKASPVKKILPEATSVLSPTKNVGNHTRLIQQKLIQSTGCTSQDKEVVKVVEERKKEISSLVNRWEKLSSSSSVENNFEEQNNATLDEGVVYSLDSGQEEDDEESVYYEYKEENVNNEISENNYEDEIYSDKNGDDAREKEFDHGKNVFFMSEKEMESEEEKEENCSHEQNCNSVSLSSQNGQSETSSIYSRSSYSDNSNYHASHSGSCSSGSSVRSYNVDNSAAEESVENQPKTTEENTKSEVPLTYTVSFYRKQKQTTKLTPVQTIVRRERVISPDSTPNVDYMEIIQQQLKALQDEILKQQTVISQTSHALNHCHNTAEFSGSIEQVEAEKLLLIASQKRQACLHEIERLKMSGAQGENIADGTGTLAITDLQLPLKRTFVASQLEGKEKDTVHYFFCLIRYRAQVIVTQMMSSDERSSDGTLSFTNHIQLRNLLPNFSVAFEVYALQNKKEVLPHDKKYHIKRDSSKIRLTPKGKKVDGKMPAVSSPGGPNAVRTSSFGLVGYTRFTLQNCNKRTFTLDKVHISSPLDGVLKVNLQLHAEHKIMEKGFLTMFEDISGFGAWQRRWWVLDANYLTYWKYPDDENRKEPIGSIDLKQCITDVVKPVSRDVCARDHTFQLVTIRPSQKGDRDTLVSNRINTLTTTTYLLSADTKDERILWCNKLNEALTSIRKWDPEALRPVTTQKMH